MASHRKPSKAPPARGQQGAGSKAGPAAAEDVGRAPGERPPAATDSAAEFEAALKQMAGRGTPGDAAAVEDSTADFEAALAADDTRHYVLRLYVTGTTPRSRRAIENLRRICDEHLRGRYRLEVIDIYQRPDLAGQAHIVAAPTLIRQLPLPIRRFIGDLSDHERVLAGLELRPASTEPRGASDG